MIWIPMAIGAALGAAKNVQGQKMANKERKRQAAIARYSPWTNLQPQMVTPNPSLFGDVATGAAAGASIGQGMSKPNPADATKLAANAKPSYSPFFGGMQSGGYSALAGGGAMQNTAAAVTPMAAMGGMSQPSPKGPWSNEALTSMQEEPASPWSNEAYAEMKGPAKELAGKNMPWMPSILGGENGSSWAQPMGPDEKIYTGSPWEQLLQRWKDGRKMLNQKFYTPPQDPYGEDNMYAGGGGY